MLGSILLKLDEKVKDFVRLGPSNVSKKAFIMKITNYELLSIMMPKRKLEQMILEAGEVIKSHLYKLDSNYVYDVVTVDDYILFIIDDNIKMLDINLIYLIYRELQLYIFTSSPDFVLEYKVSSFAVPEGVEDYQAIIQPLLSQLMTSHNSNFYIPFEPLAICDIKSNYSSLVEFKKTLKYDTISFAYQPIIDRVTGKIPYYECLLRMPDHNKKLISAGPYIGLAEQSGLNNILDQIVLEMAVEELRAAPHVMLAVNISNAGILDANLKQRAVELLSDRAVARRLIIEITETSLNLDFAVTKSFIDTMRDHGCRVALDDFGSGFTSFQQLQNLRLDIIKIDGSFIKNVILNQKSKYLVKALIEMAAQLGAKTVAEFVESAEIAKFLLDVEIDYMQGDFFSPAVNYRMWNKG
jgi:EAL domain-containing protein (putative c-di-GMP-specific phosphodiesterase class I)